MAGGKGKIHLHPKANTNGLKENPQNINKKGRSKKMYSSLSKEFDISGYNASEIKEAMSIVFELNGAQTEKILKDPNTDNLLKGLCRYMQESIAKGDFKLIKEMIEFVGGKAIQRQEIELKDITKKEPQTDEELQAEIERLEKLQDDSRANTKKTRRTSSKATGSKKKGTVKKKSE